MAFPTKMGTDERDIFEDALKEGVPEVNTEQASITNETLVIAKADSNINGIAASTFTSPAFGTVVKDELGEFASDQFTPDETGFYLLCCYAMAGAANGADGDEVRSRIYNVTDGTEVIKSGKMYLGKADAYYWFPPISIIAELTAGKNYEYQVFNNDSSFDIGGFQGLFSVRRMFR